ncbi:MAG: polyprenyl synthetase family protein [Holophagales bacterium]|nr:polyprenyl synthetase family protein [Holophagales bacterium]
MVLRAFRRPRPPAVEKRLRAWAEEVNRRLPEVLPPASERPEKVHEAMLYAALGPGKRLRPVLALAVADMFGEASRAVLDMACAIEMVHACSLVLDDMPMMDDAALRRGRATTHRVYGEDVAVLAAFGLLNRAYTLVAERSHQLSLSRYTAEDLLHLLTEAVGSRGLVGGQALDLESEKMPAESMDLERLEYIHSHKTGALFTAAAELGAMAVDARRRDLGSVTRYAKNLGLAFQIADDLLDVLATPEETGKDSQQDSHRFTFVKLLGVEGAESLLGELLDFANASVEDLGSRAEPLRVLTAVVRRKGRL